MSPQVNIAHYRITGKLGQGGMGEVFRATDTRLNREVAIKVIPDAFAQDPERMARFEREAQVLASLNHPNIAAIYGLERNALVMELVEGPTLADRMAEGPVPIEEALAIARQMADALEAAHEKGIVHRDLKPANVKLTPEGKVKVLDFGLAKIAERSQSSADPANSPTLTQRHSPTIAGVIMGTAGYMAPEQARGTAVDKRADIWAFGVVLFEMLTGRQTFAGETVSDQLASVLKTDPDWTQLPAETPSSVRRLLRRCLQRDRSSRLRDIADARIEIDTVEMEAPPAPLPAGRPQSRIWMVVAAVATLAAAILGIDRYRRQPVEAPPLRFTIPLPPKLDLGLIINASPALSPDGTALAFVASDNNLWVRRLTEGDARQIAGTKGATNPFWSPDSRRIAFFTEGKLKRVAIAGGPPEVVCDAPDGRGGAWSSQGVIVFAPSNSGLLYRVAATGGNPVPATLKESPTGTVRHRQPVFLPDGRHFLYAGGLQGQSGVYIGDIDAAIDNRSASAPVRLMPTESAALYAHPGYLLFLRDRVLLAQPFDADRLALYGEAFPVAQNIDSNPLRKTAEFSVSQTGVLIWRENAGRNFELAWLDRKGKALETIDNQAGLDVPQISPDGKRAVFLDSATGANAKLWLMDFGRKLAAPVTSKGAYSPIWTVDGTRVVFSSVGSTALVVRDVDGGQEQQLPGTGVNRFPVDWTRDGRFLLFREQGFNTKIDLWLLPMHGDPKPISVLHGDANEDNGRFSPDNRWLAYQSDESGQYEVYVTAFSAGQAPAGAKWRLSAGGGALPSWRRDGKELFYTVTGTDGRLTVMAVMLSGSDALQAGRPAALFDLPAGSSYDVSPDGQRFLVARRPIDAAVQPFQITLNWLAMARQSK